MAWFCAFAAAERRPAILARGNPNNRYNLYYGPGVETGLKPPKHGLRDRRVTGLP
ncbi:MAG: hypothetical protein U1E05_27375 [Patescibacteria group bacterium]|nr:hypothetical protein [Patescibacteria group bacterium]